MTDCLIGHLRGGCRRGRGAVAGGAVAQQHSRGLAARWGTGDAGDRGVGPGQGEPRACAGWGVDGGRGSARRGRLLPGRPAGAGRGGARPAVAGTRAGGVALVAVLGVARVAGADAGRRARRQPGRRGGRLGGWPVARPARADTRAERDAAAPPCGRVCDAPSAGPPDWWEVLAELDRRRARALTALDPDLLADYAQPGSAAWSADTALVADLGSGGCARRGSTSRVLAVERSEHGGAGAASRSSTSARRTPSSMPRGRSSRACRRPASPGGRSRWPRSADGPDWGGGSSTSQP